VTKRFVWFMIGAVAGSSGTVWAWVRLRRSAARPPAERVAALVADTARSGADGVRRFVDDARAQVRLAERELRPEPDGSTNASSSPAPTATGSAGRLTRA